MPNTPPITASSIELSKKNPDHLHFRIIFRDPIFDHDAGNDD